MDLKSVDFIVFPCINIGFSLCFSQICCEGSKCLNVVAADPWIPLTILNKSSLLIRLIVPNTCIGKKLYGIRYRWRETPCPFKQASIYSSTDGNLPAGPYIKVF